MKVLIDGIEYAPIPPTPEGRGLSAALDIRFDSDAGDNLTVRDYLRMLLTTLWQEGEGFSGKRPFGNSGWEYELYAPLIKAGFIEGTLDSDGYVNEVNRTDADSYVFNLIQAVFSVANDKDKQEQTR